MKTLVGFFLRRPILVHLIVFSVFGYGILSLFQMRKEGFPEVEMNRVLITTVYPGASPVDVEVNVTRLIEEALNEVDGIQEFTSISNEGLSVVDVTIDEDADSTRMKAIFEDIDTSIQAITELPKDLPAPPVLDLISSFDTPVLEVALSGSTESLEKITEYIELSLSRLPQVARTELVGMGERELQVLVDPQMAKSKYVDLRMIASAIESRNLQGSGGTLESFLGEKKVVTYSKFSSYNEILDTSIRRSFGGGGVRIRDVAKLVEVREDMNLMVRNNGKTGVSILILMKEKGDILDTIDSVKAKLQEIELPADVRYQLMNDQSKLTRDRLQLVASNAVFGFILVGFILFLVMDLRTSFWTAFGIPFSLLGVFVVFYLLDYTLNVLTLGGFIIVIGMLVDDAVVVAEEMNTLREKGLSGYDAAVTAVMNIWKPVFSSALTTMIAFTPLLALGGLPGKFVWLIPVVVILALIVSLFESFFILPAHLSHGKPRLVEKKEWIIWLENRYEESLKFALKNRLLTIAVFLLVFTGSVVVIVTRVKKDPFPQESSEGITVQLTFEHGASMAYTEQMIQKVESVLAGLPDSEIDGFSARAGTHSKNPVTDRGTLDHIATIFVYLTSYDSRSRTAEQIAQDLRKKIPVVLGEAKSELLVELIRIGPPLGRAFEIRVSSSNDSIRSQKVQDIKNYIKNMPGVIDVDDDRVEGKDEINLIPKYDLVAESGISVADLLFTIRAAFDGMIVSNITDSSSSKDIRLRLTEPARADPEFLAQLPLINKQDRMLRLPALVNLEQKPAQGEIRHVNGIRTITVFGTLDSKQISPEEIMKAVDSKFQSSRDVEISFAGQPRETEEIFKNLQTAAVSAFLGIYLVIALIFNSFTRPLIVLFSIPFMITGVSIALFLHSTPLSIFTGLGIVGLMGVIVNAAIVLVHTIKDRAGNSEIARDHIMEGSVSRLRPVLMTTLTTVIGLLPTAYGLGGYDPFITPMSLVLAYGLIFGTSIVLILVPLLLDFETSIVRSIRKLKPVQLLIEKLYKKLKSIGSGLKKD